MLDLLDTKKKLPGERKPVFPEGVPGLEQGVPKDLYKGARQQQLDEQNAARRGRSRRRRGAEDRKGEGQVQAGRSSRRGASSRAAERGEAAPAEEEQRRRGAAAAQAEEDRAQAHHRAAARSADAQHRRSQRQPSSNPAFPAPLPSGTFTR